MAYLIVPRCGPGGPVELCLGTLACLSGREGTLFSFRIMRLGVARRSCGPEQRWIWQKRGCCCREHSLLADAPRTRPQFDGAWCPSKVSARVYFLGDEGVAKVTGPCGSQSRQDLEKFIASRIPPGGAFQRHSVATVGRHGIVRRQELEIYHRWTVQLRGMVAK